MRRPSTSIVIVSPSRTAAIGPPRAASGATWPAMKPCVAPEKRPSVSSATSSPRPAPMIAAVTREHLAHARARRPGPRCGSRRRRPASMPPCVTAAIAASSPSNTRAGPVWWRRSWPASFTTQPSGARLPRRIARPPVGLSGSSSGRTTCWPVGLARPRRRCSPTVLPVTVDRVRVQQAELAQALGEHAARRRPRRGRRRRTGRRA